MISLFFCNINNKINNNALVRTNTWYEQKKLEDKRKGTAYGCNKHKRNSDFSLLKVKQKNKYIV